MMQEKAMVSDALNSIDSGLKAYADMISQTENQELRSALQQMRNDTEKSQFELYTLAKNLSYYHPAQKANQEEVNNLKSIFSGSTGSSSSTGMSGSAGSSSNTGTSGYAGSSTKSGYSNNTGKSSNTDSSGTSWTAGGSDSSNYSDTSGSSENSGKSNSSKK